MAPRLTIAELVDRGDLDDLLRRTDDLCDNQDWAGLLDLRDRSRAAFHERGRQLWPAASHAEYRLALQAPGQWAAQAIAPGAGRFALGPLSEVAASTHEWDELAPYLGNTPEAALIAQERVVRGEDLTDDDRVDALLAELPLVLEPWEPAYPLARYEPYGAEFEDVPAPSMEEVALPAAAAASVVADPDAVHALTETVTPWATQSNGGVAAVAVDGDAAAAIGALGVTGSARLVEVDAAHALAVLAWAGASGGAHGRRRGMAQGRFTAWWTAAALAGALHRWPDLVAGGAGAGGAGGAIEGLRWYRWDRPQPSTGWVLRLAAERPRDGRAWAVEATDEASTA